MKPPTLRLLLHFAIGTILSMLVFFSISFLTFIFDLHPFNPETDSRHYVYTTEVGFPFTYYKQDFMGADGYPFAGWNGKELLLDCAITWLIIALSYTFFKVRKDKRTTQIEHSELIDEEYPAK